MAKNPFVNLDNARLEEQKRVMEEILAAGHCPFCPEHLSKYHKQPIIYEIPFWLVTPNQWPYEHTRLHLLLIYKDHVEMPGAATPDAFRELNYLLDWATWKYEIKSGALCLRFGEMEAATVKHLHAHLIVPDPDKPVEAAVRFKVG